MTTSCHEGAPMIDLKTEEILSLIQAAKKVGVSFPTIWRWALKGLPGPDGQRVRLRASRLGARWITSVQALQEFTERLTPRLDDKPVPLPRSIDKRRAASERAAKALEQVGI
jgi:hypothetical protein